MNNEIQQRAKELLEQGAERRKKRLAEINRQEEKSLRDHFAGLAMNGLISSQYDRDPAITYYTPEGREYLANLSYLISDAMLKARKEVSGE
ncbi:hypothetical protein ACR79N_16065 [Sphingobacterium siyangense]|uniref:hypothetical protein n=1 Tax=Sphingobacterium siyangense TaxID=459529 RepID=UPI003DA489AD